MDDRSSPIIIIKRKKKIYAAHHGGSWKVAYADFVTALMAFFLLLWLITMVSPEKRLALSEYFKNFNIFK
ncbi:MAG TPA: flagellar motor protein MotB, partial [Syntrophales bacterium]|nr:flagellar motor protein MotB [Syntrophales bacterium]